MTFSSRMFNLLALMNVSINSKLNCFRSSWSSSNFTNSLDFKLNLYCFCSLNRMLLELFLAVSVLIENLLSIELIGPNLLVYWLLDDWNLMNSSFVGECFLGFEDLNRHGCFVEKVYLLLLHQILTCSTSCLRSLNGRYLIYLRDQLLLPFH